MLDMMTFNKRSLLALGSAIAVGGLVAASPLPAIAQAANPCAAKAAGSKANPCAAKSNPCAAKGNPCAAKAANPCAAKENPCAAKKK
jgi:hypothetical protein